MFLSLALFTVIAVASFSLGLFQLKKRSWSVIDPTVVFWFGFAVYYGIGNIWFCTEVYKEAIFDRGGFYFDPLSSRDVDALATVAALTAVYGVAVALGMFVLGRTLVRSTLSAWTVRAASAGPDLASGLLVPMCVLGWLIQLGVIPHLDSALPSVVLFVPQACCLALNAKLGYQAAQRLTTRGVLLAAGVVAVSAICGAATGMKQNILMPVLAGIAGLVLAVRRPWPVAVAILAALPAFVVLQTFNKLSRTVIWDSTAKLSVIDRIEAIGSAAMSVVAPEQSEAEFADIGRLCTAVPMMQTLALVQSGEGISFMDGLAIPHVPRALWPSKPQVLVGSLLYERVTGNEPGSSSSPGQPAEAFMYGGWFGVVALGLGMGLLAAFAGAIVQHVWNSLKAASLGVLIAMAINFGKCENWLWAYVPSVLNCVVLIVALQWATRWGSLLTRRDHTAVADPVSETD